MADKYVDEGFLTDTCDLDEDGTKHIKWSFPIPLRTSFRLSILTRGHPIFIHFPAENGCLVYQLTCNRDEDGIWSLDAELVGDTVEGPA